MTHRPPVMSMAIRHNRSGRKDRRLWHFRGIRTYEPELGRYVTRLKVLRRPDGRAVWQWREVRRDHFRSGKLYVERPSERDHMPWPWREIDRPYSRREYGWLPRPRVESARTP